MEFYYALIAFISTLVFWFFLNRYYIEQHRNFIRNFLDSSSNISILYYNDKIIYINRIGLEFFTMSTVEEFNKTYIDLSLLFQSDEDNNCIDKHTYGKKWFELLKQKGKPEYLKIKLFSKRENMNYFYNIGLSKLGEKNQYLLSFNDITKLESEKNIIKKEAEYDPLTNIYNRVKFNKVFSVLIFNANKFNMTFSVILIDIDHFKNINDDYGHNIGDKVLVELSRLVKMTLRDEDIFARWGGEEFVILLESTGLKKASELAERLKRIVNTHSFPIENRKITCSFGVTEFKLGDTQTLLFNRVDKALYQAKNNGRNQVVIK